MTASRRRRRRAVLLVVVAMAGLGVVLGGGAGAGAAPAGPAAPASPSQPTQCTWIPDTINKNDARGTQYTLTCPQGVTWPRNISELPPPPAGCSMVTVRDYYFRFSGWATEVPDCPAAGTKYVRCRNEYDFWPDEEHNIEVPDNAPQWFLDEIQAESTVDEGQGCSLAENPPTAMCADTNLDTYDPPGLLPDQCWGTYPTANYELSWDDGAWYDVGQYQERLMGWLTSFFFLVGRSSIQVVLWLVDWAFSFDIKKYTNMASSVADRYDGRIVTRWDLDTIVWLALVGFVGYSALRGRFKVAGGELLMTIVLLGLSLVLFQNREFYMDYSADVMRMASDELLVAARPYNDPGTGQGEGHGDTEVIPDGGTPGNPNPESPALQAARRTHVIRPIQHQVHVEFVERPYVQLNWGVDISNPACVKILNNITATGWDDAGWPARYMERSSCPLKADIARFNRDVGGTRLFSALLVMLMGLLVSVFLGLAAISVVLAKFLLAVLFVVTPFVPVAAVLPGTGRRMAWSWVATFIQVVVVAVGMSFLLSLLMLGVSDVLEMTREEDPIERWAIVLVIVGVVYFTRKRLLTGTQAFSTRVADSLTRMSPSSAQWSGSSSVGFDFDRTDRLAARGGYFAGYGATVAAVAAPLALGRMASTRWAERRVARRGRRNLEHMERTREFPQMESRIDAYEYGGRALPAPGGGAGAPQDGEFRRRYELIGKLRALPPRRRFIRRASAKRHHARVIADWQRKSAAMETMATAPLRPGDTKRTMPRYHNDHGWH